jgi:adenine-specific DNA-methyltransferase
MKGVGSGFKYKTVPHITLKSIANNEPSARETLYDQPNIDNSKRRVTGPFTVEAVPAPIVKSIDEIGEGEKPPEKADESIARSGETLRQSEWRDELFRTGIRGKNGQMILFSRVEALPGTRWLHADAETKPNDRGGSNVQEMPAQRVVISFGPEYAPLEQKQVELAIEEARSLVPKPKIIVFAAFQFDPEAAKDIDETNWPGMTLLKAQMNADLLTEES